MTPDAGPGLVFITLPHVFNTAFASMPVLGYVFSLMFYVLLFLAALTSTISLHEIATAFLIENYKLTRQRATWLVTIVCMLLGTACCLSFGPWADIKIWNRGFFDLFDFITAKFMMPMGGILIAMFVEWYLDRKMVVAQLTNDGTVRVRCLSVLLFLIRWVAPIGVGAVFLNELAN